MNKYITVSTGGNEYFTREWQGDDAAHVKEQFDDVGLGEILVAVLACTGWPINVEEKKDERTLKDLANDALFAQTASNLSGIVYAFARAMKRLRELEPDKGTEFYNRHPICVLFTTQFVHLTKCEGDGNYSESHEWCSQIVKGGK